MSERTILWRRLDRPGHETAKLSLVQSSWELAGTAVFAHEKRPCRLDYVIVCNLRWETQSARVAGWMGDEIVDVALSVDTDRRWRLKGAGSPTVAGCIDVDLNFSPSTNLLPIRRLELAIGQEAEVRAAWLRFPSFTLKPLTQLYRRIDAATYRYESAGGRFVAELEVDESGFVLRYPNFCQAEADN